MKNSLILIILSLTAVVVAAQTDTVTKFKFVIGVSAPELAHAGISVDLGKHNQLGVSAGIGPTWGGVWPSLNAEHRFYFSNLRDKTNRSAWFFRQSIHYFPGGDDAAASVSAGVDLRSKRRQKGWTIDAGMFFLLSNERENKTAFPSLRFQFYNYFKKATPKVPSHE